MIWYGIDNGAWFMIALMYFIVVLLVLVGLYLLAKRLIYCLSSRGTNSANGGAIYGTNEKVEVGHNPYGSGVNITFSNVGNGGGNQMGMINAGCCCRVCNSCRACTGCQVVDCNDDAPKDKNDGTPIINEEAEPKK